MVQIQPTEMVHIQRTEMVQIQPSKMVQIQLSKMVQNTNHYYDPNKLINILEIESNTIKDTNISDLTQK